jgi:hypothetical protein
MYAALMQTTGWTEAPLLLQFVPVRSARRDLLARDAARPASSLR